MSTSSIFNSIILHCANNSRNFKLLHMDVQKSNHVGKQLDLDECDPRTCSAHTSVLNIFNYNSSGLNYTLLITKWLGDKNNLSTVNLVDYFKKYNNSFYAADTIEEAMDDCSMDLAYLPIVHEISNIIESNGIQLTDKAFTMFGSATNPEYTFVSFIVKTKEGILVIQFDGKTPS